jgi:hypothetical protein
MQRDERKPVNAEAGAEMPASRETPQSTPTETVLLYCKVFGIFAVVLALLWFIDQGVGGK